MKVACSYCRTEYVFNEKKPFCPQCGGVIFEPIKEDPVFWEKPEVIQKPIAFNLKPISPIMKNKKPERMGYAVKFWITIAVFLIFMFFCALLWFMFTYYAW